MARALRRLTGNVWVAAGAAITLSAAAFAQNAAVNARFAEMAIPAPPVAIEPEIPQAKHQVMPTSRCGSSLGQFLKVLTNSPNPFEAGCGLSEDW
ncbi:hypothetical protein [Erythrobacter sp. R86502]|uniref:hypothetical protein n=1 Tax=Erythrobacter sp. R86502 TaxID=3093846 RepID=UPI0036D2D1CF